ncbi:hypothetical protein FRC11_005749 [Ceratobasidium sp. 423]|nr:hypothetical protein FRC11_005749 [Ceratobasidium sp. 423]
MTQSSTPARLPTYNAATRTWDVPEVNSQGASSKPNQVATSVPTCNDPKPSQEPPKEKPQGLGYRPGSSISSGPRFVGHTPSGSQRKLGHLTSPNSPRQIDTLIEGVESLTLVSGAPSAQPANVSTARPKPQKSDQTQGAPSQNAQLDRPTTSESNTSEMQRRVEMIINDLRGLDIASRQRAGQSASLPTSPRVQPLKQVKRPEPKTTKPRVSMCY